MITDGPLHSSSTRRGSPRAVREMHDAHAKATMLDIAVMRDRMADGAANREDAAK